MCCCRHPEDDADPFALAPQRGGLPVPTTRSTPPGPQPIQQDMRPLSLAAGSDFRSACPGTKRCSAIQWRHQLAPPACIGCATSIQVRRLLCNSHEGGSLACIEAGAENMCGIANERTEENSFSALARHAPVLSASLCQSTFLVRPRHEAFQARPVQLWAGSATPDGRSRHQAKAQALLRALCKLWPSPHCANNRRKEHRSGTYQRCARSQELQWAACVLSSRA